MESAYEPCTGDCCDEAPTLCPMVARFSSLCSYATVAGQCRSTCGTCDEIADECADDWPTCAQGKDEIPGFCELDAHRTHCRSTCGTCDVCEDSHDQQTRCAVARSDLRRCSQPRTMSACPRTCGACARRPPSLKELLERQPCEEAPECALSVEEASERTMQQLAACEDIGYCGFTKARPDRQTLCADPMYRDTLCRATCGGCVPRTRARPPQELLWRPRSCSAVESRACPRRCGICTRRGRMSEWDVSRLEHLVASIDT